MKSKNKLNDLFHNDKFVLVFSLLVAFGIWLAVVINVSPEASRTIKDVKVTIDTTVPSQFGLEVFGQSEFYVDVTVQGKKYEISAATLSADDITVVAQTNNVSSAGTRTLQLKPETEDGQAGYTISALSVKTIDVYFDTAKTVQMVIEPQVVADDFPIVDEGFTSGTVNLSETVVTIGGPSTEINRIEKVVAKLVLDKSLTSNKSADAKVIPLDDSGKSDFKYLTQSIENVVLTIPVLRFKELPTSVVFKNAPANYALNPLKYTVSPAKDLFNISVDDYDKISEYAVGTVDFKNLSPSNHVFTFSSENLSLSENSQTKEFSVNVDVSGLRQEFVQYPADKITVNNAAAEGYKVSALNKSVVVVGMSADLEAVTSDSIKVEVDLSEISLSKGQSATVPAVVTIESAGCWIYGSYTVEVSL